MIAKCFVFRYVIDNYQSARVADLVTDGGFYLQFVARLKSKRDLIPHRASHPMIFCHARHGGKTHTRRAANDFENAWNGFDPGH